MEATATTTATRKAGAGSYIAAVLFPIVGVIIAIVQFARGNVGPGFALLLTSSVAFVIWFMILISMAASDASNSLDSYNSCIQHAQTLAQMNRCS